MTYDNLPRLRTRGDEATLAAYDIGVARISFHGSGLPKSMREAVEKSWRPGRISNVFNRFWRISKILDMPNDVTYYGKIASVRPKVRTGQAGRSYSKIVIPFQITGSTIAYQLIPGAVTDKLFIRIFTRLMNSGNSNRYAWRLSPLSYEMDYREWIESVNKVTKFDFELEPPNPHYRDNKIVETLIEGFKSEYVRLAGSSTDDRGVDTSSDPFRQALDHVISNYGKATLTGVDENNVESIWTKVRNSAASTRVRLRFKRTDGPEAPQRVLNAALSEVEELPLVAMSVEGEDASYSDR